MSILQDYIEKYKEIHANNKHVVQVRGTAGPDEIYGDGFEFAKKLGPFLFEHINNKKRAISVLDYGCGKAKHIHDPNHKFGGVTFDEPNFFLRMNGLIQCYYCYDPAVLTYSVKPSPGSLFDFVGCADVLEHVPEQALDEVLREITSYTKPDGLIAFSISANESWSHFLNPDGTKGENLHITIKSQEWWVEKIRSIVGDRAFVMAYTNNEIFKLTDNRYNCIYHGQNSSLYSFDHNAFMKKKYIKWKK